MFPQQAPAPVDPGVDWGTALVEALPATIAFLGIVVGLVWNQITGARRWHEERAERQTAWEREREERRLADQAAQANRRKASDEEREARRVAREHEHELERNRVLRSERLALYPRLIDAAGHVLGRTSASLDAPSNQDLFQQAMASNDTWATVHAESRFLAADPVYAAAVDIENLRKDWLAQRTRHPFWEKLFEELASGPLGAEDSPASDSDNPPVPPVPDSAAWWKRRFELDVARQKRGDHASGLMSALVSACKADVHKPGT